MPLKLVSLAFFFIAVSAVASGSYQDIEIVSSSANGISFRLKVENPEKYLSLRSADSGNFLVRTVLVAFPFATEPLLLSARGNLPVSNIQLNVPLLDVSNGFAEIVNLTQSRGIQLATSIFIRIREVKSMARLKSLSHFNCQINVRLK